MKTVKVLVNGKTQYYDVYPDKVLGRGGKVIAELGDYKRPPTAANGFKPDADLWYRALAFVATGPTSEPVGIVVKCAHLPKGKGSPGDVRYFPEGHHVQGEWFFWLPWTELKF